MTPPTDEMRGATVVLTGVGKRGQVGEGVAASFAAQGAKLVLISRNRDEVRERAADVARQAAAVHPFSCDLTNPAETAVVADQVGELAPDGVAAVVHMAGGYVDGAP